MFLLRILSVILVTLYFSQSIEACDSCTIPNLGKNEGQAIKSSDDQWFFKYTFEEQNWHDKEAGEAHELHHDGYHVHNKTREYFHHFSLGGHFSDKLTAYFEIPYILRDSTEIHSHSILGSHQRSRGLGDLHVIGLYNLGAEETSHFNLVAGIKFPTGHTKEKNSIGTLFEPELQPGSGSFDYILGGLYQTKSDSQEWTLNLAYVLKTEGDAEYEFGDVLSSSLLWQHVWEKANGVKIKAGIDSWFQYEQKHKENGTKHADSGGVTVLMGPALTIETSPSVSFFASGYLPAYQDLGGIHQELDYVYNAGGQLHW